MHFFNKKWPAILLWPLSLLYNLVVNFRNWLYKKKFLPTIKLDCQVISIGNINVGGTGKTPTTAFLANWLLKKGKRVAILSRGYGRRTSGTVLVADEQQILRSFKDTGDEPLMLATLLPGVPVVVDENRVRGGQFLVSKFQPDYILLDDGFQHQRLYRNYDIITFGANFIGNGFTLPAGPLREKITSLKRADLIWFNGTKHPQSLQSIKKPVIRASYNPLRFCNDDNQMPAISLSGKKVISYCALASPDQFFYTLKSLGADLVWTKSFSDHHLLTDSEIEMIERQKSRLGADFVITTQKDWIKLPTPMRYNTQWYYLLVEILPENIELLDQTLEAMFKN